MPQLLLGPVLRYVDHSRATVWVQTDSSCEVEVLGRRARTFQVAGHHFAVVVIEGLEPGSSTPYGVALDGRAVWPEPDDGLPLPTIRTIGDGGRLRLVFGSCREVAPHEPPFALEEDADPLAHGLDALRTYGLELAGRSADEWPDVLLMLGDQLYADEPPRRLAKVLRKRHDRPDGEARAVSFADYALLYRLAWSDPTIRWLLSTLPSMMIFDDHEILDEWKISQAWVQERRSRPEYQQRVAAGLMAYWVFQHIGNLSPAELRGDDVFGQVCAAEDAGDLLREVAAEADRQVGQSRWSFARELGRTRLLVLDSRAARRLEPGHRRIIDDDEWRWAVSSATAPGEVDHLVLASSLPFLLPAGLHHLEAALERLADGAWGVLPARAAEGLRRALNLGHWASFQASFRALSGLLSDLARGGSDGSPASVVLLSGDVHHGYLARLRIPHGEIPVWQVVSSPFRKRLSTYERRAMRLSESAPAARLTRALARAAGVAPAPLDWELDVPADYSNQLGTLETSGREARVRLLSPRGSDWRAPRLKTLWERRLV